MVGVPGARVREGAWCRCGASTIGPAAHSAHHGSGPTGAQQIAANSWPMRRVPIINPDTYCTVACVLAPETQRAHAHDGPVAVHLLVVHQANPRGRLLSACLCLGGCSSCALLRPACQQAHCATPSLITHVAFAARPSRSYARFLAGIRTPRNATTTSTITTTDKLSPQQRKAVQAAMRSRTYMDFTRSQVGNLRLLTGVPPPHELGSYIYGRTDTPQELLATESVSFSVSLCLHHVAYANPMCLPCPPATPGQVYPPQPRHADSGVPLRAPPRLPLLHR